MSRAFGKACGHWKVARHWLDGSLRAGACDRRRHYKDKTGRGVKEKAHVTKNFGTAGAPDNATGACEDSGIAAARAPLSGVSFFSQRAFPTHTYVPTGRTPTHAHKPNEAGSFPRRTSYAHLLILLSCYMTCAY